MGLFKLQRLKSRISRILIGGVLSLTLGCSISFAQGQADSTDQSTVKKEPMGSIALPYNNPMVEKDRSEYGSSQDTSMNSLDLGKDQKNVMNRFADIYRIHVLAIEAQINNDPLSAEKYIDRAFSELQNLMNDNPKVQNSPRFSELYRSVMTEYREFYGINEPVNKVKGEIFKIREEVFSESDNLTVEEYELPANLSFSEYEVPMPRNSKVNRHLIYLTMKRPEVMENWLQRSEKYFPMMKEIFKEAGIPQELIHLAMIESGLTPEARSPAAAVGMWQFIRATGSMYGLEVNWWIDERKDPVKATRAAARHLKDLYDIWGDWHLAMANYNVSPRRLKQAIRAGGGEKNYWNAYSYLPSETRGYVPGFIATTLIANNPVTFGFKADYGVEPYEFEVVEVEGLMPLDKLADAAGISEKKLRDYNPELLRWATPPDNKYPLKIPSAHKEQFVENYKEIPKDDRKDRITIHEVRRGETLGEIANKYGTSVRALYETNRDLSSTIYPGEKIAVPLPAGSNTSISATHPSKQPRSRSSKSRQKRQSAPPNTERLVYDVKKGNTIGHIAEWYDTRAWKIRSWNNTGNLIHAGDRLVIYVPESKVSFYRQINELSFSKKQSIERQQRRGVDVTEKQYVSVDNSEVVTYQVRPNDTLSEIADAHNVSIQEIKRTNNLNGSRIYVGQTLKIRKP